VPAELQYLGVVQPEVTAEPEAAVWLQMSGLKASAKSKTAAFSYLLALTVHTVKATPRQKCLC